MIGLGSRTQLGIGIAVYLEDKFSQKAKLLNENLKALHKGALHHVDKAARDYRNTSMQIAAGAAIMTAGLYKAAEAGAEFEHKIRQIKIVGGKELTQDMTSIWKNAERIATLYGERPIAVADAMLENVRAGITEGLDEITERQLMLAKSSGEALEGVQGVAHGTLAVLGQFGLKATQMYDFYGSRISGINYVTNALQVGANKSMASVNNIQESLQYFGFTAARVNMTLEESVALIGQMAASGIKGSAAGTGLNNLLGQLTGAIGSFAGPKKKAALAKLGLTSEYAIEKLNAGKTYELLQDIAALSSKLNLAEQIDVGRALFNIRGDRGQVAPFLDLIKGVAKTRGDLDVEKLRRDIIEGIKNDELKKQAAKMTDDLFTDLKRFVAQLDVLKNTFVKVAGPTLRLMAQFATAAVKGVTWLLDSPIGKVFGSLVAVAAPLVAIFFGFKAVMISAAFAVRTFTNSVLMSAMTNGYGSKASWLSTLTGGVLGGAGKSSIRSGSFVQGASGKWRLAPGHAPILNPATGKMIKPGQFVPTSMVNAVAKGTGWLPSIGKGIGRWLPILGPILLGVEAIRVLLGDSIAEQERQGKLITNLEWQREMFRNMVNDPNMRPTGYNPYTKTPANINIHIDGEKVGEAKVDDINNVQNQLPFTFKR